MKKYLFNGAMALIVGGFIVSCSHDDISQPATVDQMTKSFDEMFTELYGPIAENHTWGFNNVEVPEEAIAAAEAEARAATRTADTNNNEWAAKGYNVPGEITDREKEVVMEWFRTHERPRSETIDIHNYFIQNVGYTDHTYYAYYQKDGRTETVTITNPGNNNMDYIFVGPGYYLNYGMTEPARITGDNGDDHVNNFNAGSGQIQHIMYSGSEYFGFHDSYGNGYSTAGHGDNGKYCEKNRNFVIRFIDVDGVVGCYVGFNYESGKTSEGWHLEPDGFFDDRVIKLVAAEGVIGNPDAYKESKTKKTYTHKKIVDQGRVFCEDIATAYRNVTEDIDYNDIVFDARVWEICDLDATTVNNITTYSSAYNYRWQYDISLLATGGTIEEKINGVDVHNKFGVGQAFMVNTWTPNCVSTLSGQWNTPTNLMQPKDFSYTLKQEELPNYPKVDISTIPIEVKYDGANGGVKALNNREVIQDGTDAEGNPIIKTTAPYKLCLPVGTLWPIERVNIKDAYKYFSAYVADPTYKFYDSDTEDGNLYMQAPESSIQKDGKTTGSEEVTQSGDTENSNVWVVWKGVVSKDGSAITLYNFDFKQDQTLRFFGTGTITVVCGANNSQSLISSRSMSDGYVDVEKINSDQASALSDGIMIYGSNFTLTKIVVL